MLFPFLKYVKPTWYFNLKPPHKDYAYWVDWRKMSQEQKNVLEFDNNYSSFEVGLLDAAYQAWHKGIIVHDPTKQLEVDLISPTVTDNYRFLRKYQSSVWSFYVLILRLLFLNNPVKEIYAFIRVVSVKPFNIYEKYFDHFGQYNRFDSALVKKKPKVSVVIPTLNRYPYLFDVLKDLEQQTYNNFDVIIIDQSEPFQKEFYQQFKLDIKLAYQREKALWLARNTAIKQSNAEWLLLFDDDSRVDNDWISQHLKCIDYFKADISSGVSYSVVGARIPKRYSFFSWSDQLDTGNVLLSRNVFKVIGLFDRQFEKQRMGDGEFGLRAYLEGLTNISNSKAKRLHLKVGAGGLRQMGSWDAFRPKKFFAPRPIPSVLYFYRKYYGNILTRFALLKHIPMSLSPYQYKGNKMVKLVGWLLLIPIFPLVLFKVWQSWKLATIKLEQGHKIEQLP